MSPDEAVVRAAAMAALSRRAEKAEEQVIALERLYQQPNGVAWWAARTEKAEREAERLHAEFERLRGTFETESAERVRCRDGWASAAAEVERLRAALAGVKT